MNLTFFQIVFIYFFTKLIYLSIRKKLTIVVSLIRLKKSRFFLMIIIRTQYLYIYFSRLYKNPFLIKNISKLV